MPIIEFPNGERIEFPDSMGEEEINSAAGAYWSGKQKGTMGAAERFGYGAGNVALGLSQMAAKATEAVGIPRGVMAKPISAMESELQQRQTEYEARKPEGFDYARMAGEIAATLPLAVAGGLPGAVAGGALAGAATPIVGAEDSYWTTKAQQAGLGAVGGAAGILAGKALGKLFSGAANAPAKALTAEGVTPTLGQAIGPKTAALEEKATSIPLLGGQIIKGRTAAVESLNVAAYNRALKPIGSKASGVAGREGVEEVFTKLSDAFDEIAPKLAVDTKQLAEQVGPTVLEAGDRLAPTEHARFSELVQKAIAKPTFKDAESYLNEYIDKYNGMGSTPDTRMLADALDDVLSAGRDALARQNPSLASRLRAINEGWANYAIIRKAAAGSKEGVFTPEGLDVAVKTEAIRRRGKTGMGQYAQGYALMQDLSGAAIKILGRRVPDSGTAGRLMTGAVLTGLAGGAYSQGLINEEQLAAGAALAIPYASPLTRSIAARAILARPAGAQVAGRAIAAIGQGAAPGTGLVLAEAGAP